MDIKRKFYISDLNNLCSYLKLIDTIECMLSDGNEGFVFFGHNDVKENVIALNKEDQLLGVYVKEAIIKVLRERFKDLNEDLKKLQESECGNGQE